VLTLPTEKTERAALEQNKKSGGKRLAANIVFYVGCTFSLLFAIVLLLNATPVFGVFGIHFYTELTDAMAPEIPRGSLLVTMRKNPEAIQPGDVVTFQTIEGLPDSRLTRVVSERVSNPVSPNMVFYRTKNDRAPEKETFLLNQTNILGVKILVLPGAGYVLSAARIAALPLMGICAGGGLLAVILRKMMLSKG
jgi:hypothetical protein